MNTNILSLGEPEANRQNTPAYSFTPSLIDMKKKKKYVF